MGTGMIEKKLEPQWLAVGTAYYPDYLVKNNPVYGEAVPTRVEPPADRIKRDLDRMVELGLTLIRMGEFSWLALSPVQEFFKEIFLI